MRQKSIVADDIHTTIENIGGIDQTEVTFSAGVTVLAGRNATNRTSFLKSIMAGLGSDNVSLKGDAERGRVELTIGDETYTRILERRNGTIVTDGDPYLEDAETADLFAFLLEDNEARRAVSRGDDLRDILMQPVDTDEINAQIEQYEAKKRSLSEELDNLESLEHRRQELETKQAELESQIEETRSKQEAKAAEIAEFDQDLEETRSNQEALESELDALNDTRSELESVRFDLETQQKSLETVRQEREEIESELEALSETPEAEIDRIDDELASLRSRQQSLNSVVNDLQRIIQFNENVLDESETPLSEALADDESSGAVTDQLLAEETTVCWTCGSEINTDRIEETLERLKEHRTEQATERREISSKVNDLRSRRSELEKQEEKRQRLETKLGRLAEEVDEREARIDELTAKKSALTDEVASLEERVESLDVATEYEDMIELHQEANELEFTLDRLEDELKAVESELEDLDDRLEERASIENELEEVTEALQACRGRIDRIEAEAVEQFNEHMEAVLDRLAYDNLDRIWIERTTETVRKGRRKVQQSTFDLHVVRTTESGRAYEDTIDHLSESEREVTGIIVGLAGYLAHDVYETVPFFLLDSLEAIDSTRISELLEYVSEYADALVVALLPEDANAVDDAHERVTEI